MIKIASLKACLELCNKFSEQLSYQSIVFMEYLRTYCKDGDENNLQDFEVAEIFMKWQMKKSPAVKFWNKEDKKNFLFKFEHYNDLSWNRCITIYKMYAGSFKKESLEKLPEFGEIPHDFCDDENDPMMKAINKEIKNG